MIAVNFRYLYLISNNIEITHETSPKQNGFFEISKVFNTSLLLCYDDTYNCFWEISLTLN